MSVRKRFLIELKELRSEPQNVQTTQVYIFLIVHKLIFGKHLLKKIVVNNKLFLINSESSGFLTVILKFTTRLPGPNFIKHVSSFIS